MEFQHLRYFVRVAEQASFTKAAIQLDMTQPALSRKIRELEVELRASLFHRNGRGAQLTPAGRRFLDYAQGLLHGAASALRAVREDAAIYEGRVVVGLPPHIGTLIIPPLVEGFTKSFPKASLTVTTGLSVGLGEQLLAGKLDFAVLRNPASSRHLAVEPIVTEALYLAGVKPVGRKRGAVSLSDLARVPLITPSAPHTFRPMLEAAMSRMGRTLNVKIEVDAVDAISELAARGLGYIVVPESNLRVMPADARLSYQKIAVPQLSTSLCLVTPAHQPQTPLQREATQLARTILSNLLQAIPTQG